MTPVRVYLRGYFARLIGTRGEKTKTARKRVKPLYSGEALTQDNVFERLEAKEREKTEKEQQKAARARAKGSYIE